MLLILISFSILSKNNDPDDRDESPPPPPPPPAPRKTSRRIGEGSQSRKRSQNRDPNQPAGGTSLWSSGSLKRPQKPVRSTVASRARSLSPRSDFTQQLLYHHLIILIRGAA